MLVCLRYHSQPTKKQAGCFAPRYRLPFHHVMIDVEGRITPADIDGAAYVLTYVSVTTGAPLSEIVASVKHSDLRRALMKCVCRAKTWPMLVAHDRGKGFVNALMEELWSLLGVEQRVGSAWRPVEQPLVERVHQGEQKELGIFLHGFRMRARGSGRVLAAGRVRPVEYPRQSWPEPARPRDELVSRESA